MKQDEDGESEEGPELFNCELSPRSVSSVVTHNVFLQTIVKK